MGNPWPPGPRCGHGTPDEIDDGTSPRTRMHQPGPAVPEQSWSVREYWRRVGYVKAAWERAASAYVQKAIIDQVGKDAWAILTGVLAGLLMTLGVLVVTVGIGALVGGALGSLAGGVGALPGAVYGADVGLTIGEGILAWLGVGFLLVYLGSHLRDMGEKFLASIRTAWDSGGDPAVIDAAAHQFADGVGYFVSLLIQAIVVYLTKQAAGEGAAAGMARLRDSLLFKSCPRIEPWLIENFPKLRAKYVPLRWTVLQEGPTIPGTSVSNWMRIKVGEREFYVWRDPDVLPFKVREALKDLGIRTQTGDTPSTLKELNDLPKDRLEALSKELAKRGVPLKGKGHVLEHLGERAQTADRPTTLEQANRDLAGKGPADSGSSYYQNRKGDVGRGPFARPDHDVDMSDAAARQPDFPLFKDLARTMDKRAARATQTDFPISSLAAALDQAEAQLIFKPPQRYAKPVKLDNWELVIDTTQKVWRVEHAVYTSNPKW